MARSVRQFKETIEFRSLPLNRIKSHRYFPAAIISLVILMAACIHVWQRVLVMGLVHEVAVLEQESAGLVDVAQKVQTEIEAMSMATRIEKYAIDSLGMQRVTADRLVTLAPEAIRDLSTDELATMISSIKRAADALPVLNDAKGAERELQKIRFDTDEPFGGGQ